MDKIIKYLVRGLVFAVIVILLGLTISSIFYTADLNTEPFKIENNERVIIVNNNFILILSLLCISIMILYLLYKISLKIKTKWIYIFVLLSIFISCIIWIAFAQNLPREDQLAVFYTARYFLKSSEVLDFTKGLYFWLHPYQLGFVLFLEIIFYAYNSMYFIQMMNSVFIIVIAISLYHLTKQIFNSKKSTKIIFILLLGYLYFEFISTFIYGNIPGLMFALLSIIFLNKYIKENKNKYIVFSGIFIVIANILKPNYLIFLIAEVIVILLDSIVKKRIKNLIFVCTILLLLCISNLTVRKLYENRLGM